MEKDQMIKELVSDSISKVKSQAENNERILAAKHNTMNWLLAFVTILFTAFYNQLHAEAPKCHEMCLTFVGKVVFVLIVLAFVFYKYLFERFLNKQSYLYENLNTHHLELKYNVSKLKELYDFKDIGSHFVFSVVDFFNSFTSAKFVFYKEHDMRGIEFKNLYNQIRVLSKMLNISYMIVFILFSTFTFIAILLMFL